MTERAPVRIIGGGMTGLTVALRLAMRGLPVVVHERDPFMGGLASQTSLNGVVVDRFYHCILPTDTTLLELLDEIGAGGVVEWRKTRTGFFHEGRMLDMTTLVDFIRFPAIGLVDRARLAWTLVFSMLRQDWRQFDREPVSSFLRRHGGKRLFENVWEPLLIAKLGPSYDRFAASYIWATIRRMLDARASGDKAEKLGFVRGRYGRVFDAMAGAIRKAGGEILTGSAVARISPSESNDGIWDVLVGTDVQQASGVVLCTPAPVSAGLIRESFPETSARLARQEYLGVVCEVLLLQRGVSPYYVLNLTDRGLPFTGVIEMSNLTGRDEFSGHAVVYLPRYGGQWAPMWDRNDEDIHRENLEGLKAVVPGLLAEDVVSWRVHRARYVQPIHPVGENGTLPQVSLAPGLAYISTEQIHPWPVHNDAVVANVDDGLRELLRTVGAPASGNGVTRIMR